MPSGSRSNKPLEALPDGEPFSMNYQPSRLDRNALFALGQEFSREKISLCRTKYKRAHLNINDLKEDFHEFDSIKVPRSHTDAYYMVIKSIEQDLGVGRVKVKPLTTGAVAKHPDFPNTKSPGLPEKLEGYSTKREAVDDPNVLQRIRKIWYEIEARKRVDLPDVCCYARAQICSRDRNKVRSTWGYPLTVYMAEGSAFYPVLEHLKQWKDSPIAYGLEIGNGGMSYIQDALNDHPSATKIIGDWSKFDKNVPPWMIRDAFAIVEKLIDFTVVVDSEGKEWPVRIERSMRRWRRIIDYFINTPIRFSDGQRFMKHGGVPSGSCWTNIIDSILNMIMMRYLIYDTTGSLPLFDLYLGDDSLLLIKEPINLTEMSILAKEQFGAIFNDRKSHQSRLDCNVHFLGYWNIGGVPYKPIDTIIASTLYPERPVRTKLETIARLIGQAYTCFDTVYSAKFFRCADILRKEEQLSREFIESWIRDHPQNFKYLQTIGIKPKDVRCYGFEEDDECYLTQVNHARRKYIPRPHNEAQLWNLVLEEYY